MIISLRIRVCNQVMEALLERLRQAYAMGQLRLIKRIHAILYIIDDKSVAEVARILDLSKQSVYNQYLSHKRPLWHT